jgi:hypothetical protein
MMIVVVKTRLGREALLDDLHCGLLWKHPAFADSSGGILLPARVRRLERGGEGAASELGSALAYLLRNRWQHLWSR